MQRIPFFFLPPSPRVPFLVAVLVERGMLSGDSDLVLREVVVNLAVDFVLVAALAMATKVSRV